MKEYNSVRKSKGVLPNEIMGKLGKTVTGQNRIIG